MIRSHIVARSSRTQKELAPRARQLTILFHIIIPDSVPPSLILNSAANAILAPVALPGAADPGWHYARTHHRSILSSQRICWPVDFDIARRFAWSC